MVQSESAQSQNKILIVDDNPTNLRVLFEYLSGEKGYKIFVAKNGREAIERTNYAKPDIILLDIMMPEIDGYETCRRLKEQEETKDIPIIFLTAFADTDNKIKAFNRGAVDFIVKPFNQEEVLARIKTHLTISKQRKELEDTNIELETINSRLENTNVELVKANATKNKLFSIVAHDMRNKLFGLTGSIEMLESFFTELTDIEKQERIRSMSNSAHQMYKLFENLFTWARMQTGNIQVVTENIDVNSTVLEIIEFFKADAESKEIELISDVQNGCNVMYDKNMLNFIIRNLVHNAIKYCNAGDSVSIVCRHDGGYHRISVKDNGIGMKKEVCDSIFQIGAKASKLGTKKESGSGLGLIVAKEFAELNRGTLKIESEENAGTEVILLFPAYSFSASEGQESTIC